MATLKALKTRIQSVQSTRKITSAMYMVAAAKFRRAQKGYDSAKGYADTLLTTLNAVPSSVLQESDSPFVRDAGAGHTLIILIAADRGLCGSFNAQLFRRAKECFAQLQKTAQAFTVLPIGKKAFEFVRTNYPAQLKSIHPILLHTVMYADIQTIISKIELSFTQEGVTRCMAIHNQYASPLLQVASSNVLLPLSQVLDETIAVNHPQTHIPYCVPSESKFLDAFLLQYLQGILWSLIAQTFVGEYAARMAAMDNATKNSDSMIHDLKLEYNQNRQARITNELIEIISGAEALQKG